MHCPYCHSRIEKKIDYIPLSHKRKRIFDAVINAGPAGVHKDKLLVELFPKNKSEVTLRTMIHYINKVIKPLKIINKAGILRLDER